MNISGPAAVAKPEMLFYAPGDLTVTAQDAGALKNAKNNARLQSKKQSGVGISNKKILRYRQKINVFKARTRCGKLKRKYTIR